MNDEQLRRWYQTRRPPTVAGEHPAPEALVRLVKQEGPEPERLGTLDHVMQCRECGSEFELLRSIEGATEPTGARSLRKWLPLAAAVMLAVGGTLLWRRDRDSNAVRGGGPSALTLVAPADSQIAAGSRVSFVWRPVVNASRYRFDLLAEDGRLIHTSGGPDTAAVLPDSVRLEPGRYRWLIEATLPGGATESAVGSLVVR